MDSSTRSQLPKSVLSLLIILLCSFLSISTTAKAKSPQPISDYELRERKSACHADIESGLWGWKCKSSPTAKENCVLRCLSAPCYDLVYEGDPLEEGERDYIRAQEFKYCMHRLSQGESVDGVKGAFGH